MVSCGPAMSLPSTLATSEPPAPATSAAQQAVEGASAREERPAGAEGGFHPGHPPPLGHPRGPGGPPRGVTRGLVHQGGPNQDFPPFLRPMPIRPPFFIREIYKNGFLKRLPYNERKSSALAKLMKSDRFWVVFSVHDDVHPFLELWHEPTEVASKPPQYIFPLLPCLHISPTLIPADNEWSFVINFDTAAIRFACNSREVMEDWVEVVRSKLSAMGILNPKGNLYSTTPLGPPVTKPVIRDPTSPLPQPPPAPPTTAATTTATPSTTTCPETSSAGSTPRKPEEAAPPSKSQKVNIEPAISSPPAITTRPSQDHAFTTSIYLNNTPPATPKSPTKPNLAVRKVSLPPLQTKTIVTPTKKEAEIPATSQGPSVPSTSSVYLNQESPSGRHVTVIPINNQEAPAAEEDDKDDSVEYENHTYGAIFDFDEKTIERGEKSKQGESEGSPRKEKDVSASQKDSPRKEKESSSPRKEKESLSPRKEKESTSRKEKDSSSRKEKETSPRRGRDRNKSKSVTDPAPPLPHRPVLRRLSERRRELAEAVPHQAASQGARQKVRRTSRRSSSLGPLLEGGLGDLGASTLSLESLDSNPRQAVPKSERGLGGAIPRRQGPLPAAPGGAEPGPPSPTHPLLGSPPRNMNELPPGIRPPPYHPLASMGHGAPPHGAPPSANSPFPPMIPLPGLTCQLSIPPGLPLPPGPPRESGAEPPRPERSLREQQVFHLRQEISHPAGVRLQLRKKDVQTSLALGDLFGCVWVLGWKQREYPVLYNAFHMGDQIVSVSGVLIRSSSDFSKLVKLKSSDLHTEIIIRRTPFGQVFHLKPEVEGQSLGVVPHANTPELKEVIPGSQAAQAGMSSKVRSFDGQSLVSLVIAEVNGRPIGLMSKDGEAWERLQAGSRDPNRDLSVLLQPADIVSKFRKQLKNVRSHKDFLLG